MIAATHRCEVRTVHKVTHSPLLTYATDRLRKARSLTALRAGDSRPYRSSISASRYKFSSHLSIGLYTSTELAPKERRKIPARVVEKSLRTTAKALSRYVDLRTT